MPVEPGPQTDADPNTGHTAAAEPRQTVGPLTVQRLRKEDGRELILYERRRNNNNNNNKEEDDD